MQRLEPLALLSIVGVLAMAATACSTLAIATAPSKQPVHDASPEASRADATFWATLHGGQYDAIGPALDQLEAAYLAHPDDPRTAAHVAFLHVWRASERARKASISPTITDDLVVARRYFEQAVQLAPDDPRFRGFLAGMTLAEGSIHHDEKLTRTGFFAMNDAVDAWPEFNLFTRGYVMSGLPASSPRYADAVEDQWHNLDVCIGRRLDRDNPDYAPYMASEQRTGWKRVCWNSWIAPHNFEGFFLNMGDMLVKQGDPAKARKVYAQARLAREYPSWPYRDVLDRRIAQAEENVAYFRADPPRDAERRMMGQSAFSCMGCHQE